MKHHTRTLGDIEKLREAGIASNHSELIALLVLLDNGPMKMSTLGEAIPLSRAAVTTLTDRMVGRLLMRRSPDGDDRRIIMLSLTAQGKLNVERALA